MEFSKDNFFKLSDLIYRRTGIALEEEKHFEKLQKQVQTRCQKLNIDNFRKYFFVLRFEDKEEKEFQELINSLTVNETYFFRENYQFEILVKEILPELDRLTPKNRAIRILSAPCSSGEEAYSIGIYLLEEKNLIERRDFEIIGIDIDSIMIEKAKKGQYNDRSLHNVPNDLKSKYFNKKGLYYEISSDLKDAISFEVANVFNKKNMRDLGKFDVIFSRNMLIYFDDASKKDVAMTFYEMLNSNGYVLLGHAEYMNRIVSVFKPKKFGANLVYQK